VASGLETLGDAAGILAAAVRIVLIVVGEHMPGTCPEPIIYERRVERC